MALPAGDGGVLEDIRETRHALALEVELASLLAAGSLSVAEERGRCRASVEPNTRGPRTPAEDGADLAVVVVRSDAQTVAAQGSRRYSGGCQRHAAGPDILLVLAGVAIRPMVGLPI
jgi:hypothetical protein